MVLCNATDMWAKLGPVLVNHRRQLFLIDGVDGVERGHLDNGLDLVGLEFADEVPADRGRAHSGLDEVGFFNEFLHVVFAKVDLARRRRRGDVRQRLRF